MKTWDESSMSAHGVGGLFQKVLVTALLLLGAIALSLFLMFHFISTTEIGEFTALSSFILVTVLLIAGYMLGIIVLGFLAIFILPRILWQKWAGNRKAESLVLIEGSGDLTQS